MSDDSGIIPLHLASVSPRRRELLGYLNLPFQAHRPDVDETMLPGEPPAEMVKRLSQDKAAVIAATLSEGVVVAADTTVVLLGRVLGKPEDEAEAREMLQAIRGRRHTVLTGHTTLNAATGKAITDVCESKVTIRSLSDEEIEAYIASGEPMDKAGAYAVQDDVVRPVDNVVGCPANVMGLPLCHMVRDLRRHGLALPPSEPHDCRIGYGYLCSIVQRVMPGAETGPLAPPPDIP